MTGGRTSGLRPGAGCLSILIVVGLVRGPSLLAQAPRGSAASAEVHALARLEPATGLVTVGARPGARIERITVAPREELKAGAVLAILEGRAQAEAQLALALAQKARAELERSSKKDQFALERERVNKLAAAGLQAAPRVLAARSRGNEIATLFKQVMDDKNLPPRDRLDLLLKYQAAEIQGLKDERDLKEVEIGQQLTTRQRELEDRELADKGPLQDLLDRQVDLARSGVAATEVHAPRAGEVLEILAHEGEVSSGPLLLFGDTSAMVATAEVFQADAPRVKVGDRATVQVLDRALPGKVTAVGTVVGKNQLTSLDPRALQDRRVVKVTVQLDDPAPARSLINMEVDVAIQAGGAAR